MSIRIRLKYGGDVGIVRVSNPLRTLMDNVDNMQEQMGNISKEVKTLRKNQKKMLEIKTTVNRNEECLSWAQQ